MYIRHVKIRDFRNINAINLHLPRGVILIVGQNAQGKTNFLEALSLLSHARSFKEKNNEILIRQGCEFASVEGEAVTESGTPLIRIALAPGARYSYINGKRCNRLSDMAGIVNFVIFSRNDLWAFSGSPADRRTYLDRFLFNLFPAYVSYLRDYQRIVKQRNLLLRRILLRKREEFEEELSVWDSQLVSIGAKVMEWRISLVQQVNTELSKRYQEIAGIEEIVQLCYYPTFLITARKIVDISRMPLAEIAEKFHVALKDNRHRELERGYTMIGPHRDDFTLSIANRDVRRYASQGELRSAIIALKLCEIELFRKRRKSDPILLLDDILSELDWSRSQSLIQRLQDMEQVFISATSKDFLSEMASDVTVFYMRQGTVQNQ